MNYRIFQFSCVDDSILSEIRYLPRKINCIWITIDLSSVSINFQISETQNITIESIQEEFKYSIVNLCDTIDIDGCEFKYPLISCKYEDDDNFMNELFEVIKKYWLMLDVDMSTQQRRTNIDDDDLIELVFEYYEEAMFRAKSLVNFITRMYELSVEEKQHINFNRQAKKIIN